MGFIYDRLITTKISLIFIIYIEHWQIFTILILSDFPSHEKNHIVTWLTQTAHLVQSTYLHALE